MLHLWLFLQWASTALLTSALPLHILCHPRKFIFRGRAASEINYMVMVCIKTDAGRHLSEMSSLFHLMGWSLKSFGTDFPPRADSRTKHA